MKYGVRYTDGWWWVYDVAENKLMTGYFLEVIARHKARQLNERGV